MGYQTDYFGCVELRDSGGRPLTELPEGLEAFIELAREGSSTGMPGCLPDCDSNWVLERGGGDDGGWCLRQSDDAGNDYDARAWLAYFAKHLLEKFGVNLHGVVHWRGEDSEDLGTVVVNGGRTDTWDGWLPMNSAQFAEREDELRRPAECARLAGELLKLGTYHRDQPMDDQEALADAIADAVSDLFHLACARGIEQQFGAIVSRGQRNATEERGEARAEGVRMAREGQGAKLLKVAAEAAERGAPVDLLADGLRALADRAVEDGEPFHPAAEPVDHEP